MLLLLLLVACAVSQTPTSHAVPPFCYLSDGCASPATCECVWLFSYCNADSAPRGHCSLSTWGTVLIVAIVLVVLAVVTIIIGCCLCCCCKRCCRPKKFEQPIVQHHHHRPLSGNPQIFTEYDNL